MSKYIIKNCDSYNFGCCLSTNGTRLYCQCKDNTDCVMKQIVFFCKMDVGSKDNMFLISRYALADLILKLLEIEEVDE